MGRLWQHLLLMKEDPIFEFIPVETLVRKNQEDYYKVLGQCDKQGESTKFIVFSLEQILAALVLFEIDTRQQVFGPKERLEIAKARLGVESFSRKDYLQIHQDISTATASRDLNYGVKNNILVLEGTRNQVRYFYRQ
jgi:Fic family protein